MLHIYDFTMFTFEDPKYLKLILGKEVVVTTINDEIRTGVLYVIDPISKAIIPYNSIKSFEIDRLLKNNSSISFETELDKADLFLGKKQKLIDWFIRNEINVSENLDILTLNDYNATIESPYGPQQCYCDNQIVLERIQTLITKMPL
ncbi:hypothetical protein FQR65_LT08400 [Abscondita terminalis]|nr:hypothetical protein FQR65_LT08400 [Abscondita terminalis]